MMATDDRKRDLTELRRIAEAATGGSWHWAGNTDTGEPYLATWTKGYGRCQVLAIGHDDRDPDGREARAMRASMADCEYDEGTIDEYVRDWAFDAWGTPRKDARLEFVTDMMCVNARDIVVYEVAPEATTREDPEVYRADITGIRHPDAEHIATFDPPTVLALLDRLERAEKTIADALAYDNPTMREGAVLGEVWRILAGYEGGRAGLP